MKKINPPPPLPFLDQLIHIGDILSPKKLNIYINSLVKISSHVVSYVLCQNTVNLKNIFILYLEVKQNIVYSGTFFEFPNSKPILLKEDFCQMS